MVSKLVFKGEKKKGKKRAADDGDEISKKLKVIKEEDLVIVNNKLVDINSIDVDSLNSGWSTANVIGDLNGPAILIPLTEEYTTPRVLSVGKDDKVELSSEISIDEDTLNFNTYDDESELQKVIPDLSQQVFVLASMLNLVGSKKEIRDEKLNKSDSVKLSLKSRDDNYLSCKGDDLQCDSKVLTDNEIFVFVKSEVDGKVRWQIKTSNGRKLYLLSNGLIKLIKDDEDLLQQFFIIRVQIQNTVGSKKLKLLKV